MRKLSYRIEKRKSVGFIRGLLSTVFALVVSVAIAVAVISWSGEEANVVLSAIIKGSLGNIYAVIDTLIKATPIMLTGLATLIAFRAKVWNIGQEGQLYAGAIGATFIVLTFPDLNLRSAIYIPILVFSAVVAGAIWGGIPGILKSRYNVNEVIVTVMLNYVIIYVCTFLVSGPWQEPSSHYFNTSRFPDSAFLPLLFNTRLHLGFIIALVVAALIYFLLTKMSLGFEIRATGHNPEASLYKGIDTKRVTLIVMILSGAISGLAGGIEILGVHHRLIYGFSSDFGFVGIMISLLGRLHPVGVIIASIFFGALYNGSSAMQVYSDVPRSLVDLIIGLIIVMMLFWDAVLKYRIRRVR